MSADWFATTKEVIFQVLTIVWGYITLPFRFFSSLPDWIKAIVYISILCITALIAWKLYEKRDRWRYIRVD